MGEEISEDDADVFDGVMLIYIQIAFAGEFEIEAAMLGEELEHVIEEANAGGDFVSAGAFEAELAFDLSFLGIALDFRLSHNMLSSSLMSDRTAKAPSSRRLRVISAWRALCGVETPMKGTPADLALRASSTVSPRYQMCLPG